MSVIKSLIFDFIVSLSERTAGKPAPAPMKKAPRARRWGLERSSFGSIPVACDDAGSDFPVFRPSLWEAVVCHVVALDAERALDDLGGFFGVVAAYGLVKQVRHWGHALRTEHALTVIYCPRRKLKAPLPQTLPVTDSLGHAQPCRCNVRSGAFGAVRCPARAE